MKWLAAIFIGMWVFIIVVLSTLAINDKWPWGKK